MDPFARVTKPVLELMLKEIKSSITREYSMVCGVGEDIKKLESNLTAVLSVIENAENKQVNDPPVKDWLKKATADAENIIDTFVTEANSWEQKQKMYKVQPQQIINKASKERHAALQIKEISKRFDMITKEKEAFHLTITVNVGERLNYTDYVVDQ